MKSVDRDYLRWRLQEVIGECRRSAFVYLKPREGEIAACERIMAELTDPLDFPDSLGFWAFDGIRRVNYGEQIVRQLYQINSYVEILDEEYSPYPAFTTIDYPHIWHGKFYPAPPEGIGGQQFIGKWYRIYMPWEEQP